MKFLKLKTTIASILCCICLNPSFSQNKASNNAEEQVNIISDDINLSTQKKVDLWEVWNKLGKGYSLAGWLEAGWLGPLYPDKTAYTKEMLELFAELGFKTIRMPVLYEWIIDENPPYKSIVNEVPFDLFETVIKPVAEQYDQMVIIDNHHGRDLTDANFVQQIPRICGQWITLTKKYKDLPYDQYLFELRNEPTYTISNENLRVVQQAIIDSIRNYDTERILIVGANWWNASWSLVETKPYDDPNMIYTFHSYTPFDFTHQGQPWHSPYINPGITFNENNQGTIDLQNELVSAKNWSDEHNVPVFWGEFGVSWYADEESRCNYIKHATCTANELGIPWIYWDIKNSDQAFGIFEEGVVKADNVIPCFAEAMFSSSCSSSPPPPPPPPFPQALCELISNGTFNNTLEPWYWWNGIPVLENGEVRIKDIVPTNSPWDVGFSSAGIIFENGKEYEISFDAYAAENRAISVKAGLSVAPFDSYHFEELNITTTSTNYSIRFMMNANTTNAGSLEFYLGGNTTDVVLDNVSLKEVNCDTIPPPPPPLPCEELIPNSTFDTTLEPWYWWNGNPILDKGAVRIKEIIPYNQPWDVGFSTAGITFENGKQYEISFDAYAAANRPVSVKVGLSIAPFESYHYEELNITTIPTNYTITFTMNAITTDAGSLEFYLGGNNADFILDNVSLKEVGCGPLTPPQAECPLFDSYSWLNSLMDMENCSPSDKVELFEYNGNKFLFVSTEKESTLYFEDGSTWCTDAFGISCIDAFGFDNPIGHCSCGESAVSCDDGIQNGDETGVDCGGKLCEPCKKILSPVFEHYPELIKLIDPFNCNGETVEVHDFGHYVFIHISKDGIGSMYYKEAVYCQDYPNFSCLSAYNLTDPTMAWSCDKGAEPGKADEDELFGIPEKFNEEVLKIFPNPSNGQFMLEIGEQFKAAKQIQVTDVQGKVIELLEIDPTAQPLIPVDLQGYNTGNYLLHLIAGDWIKSQTVAIK